MVAASQAEEHRVRRKLSPKLWLELPLRARHHRSRGPLLSPHNRSDVWYLLLHNSSFTTLPMGMTEKRQSLRGRQINITLETKNISLGLMKHVLAKLMGDGYKKCPSLRTWTPRWGTRATGHLHSRQVAGQTKQRRPPAPTSSSRRLWTTLCPLLLLLLYIYYIFKRVACATPSMATSPRNREPSDRPMNGWRWVTWQVNSSERRQVGLHLQREFSQSFVRVPVSPYPLPLCNPLSSSLLHFLLSRALSPPSLPRVRRSILSVLRDRLGRHLVSLTWEKTQHLET
jgi:hypothetical protein